MYSCNYVLMSIYEYFRMLQAMRFTIILLEKFWNSCIEGILKVENAYEKLKL